MPGEFPVSATARSASSLRTCPEPACCRCWGMSVRSRRLSPLLVFQRHVEHSFIHSLVRWATKMELSRPDSAQLKREFNHYREIVEKTYSGLTGQQAYDLAY